MHALLAAPRAIVEHVFMSAGAPDSSRDTFATFAMLVTSRGSITLKSGDINEPPLIDPNYLATAVDRHVTREAIKTQIALAGSDKTVPRWEILDGEVGAPGFDTTLDSSSSDKYYDAQIGAALE